MCLTMRDYLGKAFPTFAQHVQKCSFASLPTPVSHHAIDFSSGKHKVAVKHDEQTSPIYGGNKIRKLEYFFQRAQDRGARRVATFGTVGSNHALATAIHAKAFGLECTCFLAHQPHTPTISATLDKHLELGTEVILWGGGDRLELYRKYLQNRKTWVIPLGGSCWLGAVGFVNAGLELAAQIEAGELATPDRIYIANGTMGSVAGLGLGLAFANLTTEIHAVRVANKQFCTPCGLERLIRKTATLMNRMDNSVPVDAVDRVNVVWRDEFFANAYAAVDDATTSAVDFAKENLRLKLDTTYTGKAMAALLHDLEEPNAEHSSLFWNTYNSKPLTLSADQSRSRPDLPEQFQRYYQGADL